MKIATELLSAIDIAVEMDQGASYRGYLKQVLPHMGDAYRGADKTPHRSHLGASSLGDECGRKIWMAFRWMTHKSFDARILRLFNRGHLEEARFIALLLAAGIQVFQQDANGNQFRISDCGGHFGGSGDGVALGIPDIPAGEYCLLEFKTHNDKSFQKLVKEGMRATKPEHFVQMQTYMRKMGLRFGLYMAVNKNDDSIHAEIIELEEQIADAYIDRGRKIIMLKSTPPRQPGAGFASFKCKFCDARSVCFDREAPERNCRSCQHAEAVVTDGTWRCNLHNVTLEKEQLMNACMSHKPFSLL